MNQLSIEMAYTTWAESCQDPYITPEGSLRQCRRRNNHTGDHASDHPLTTWKQ